MSSTSSFYDGSTSRFHSYYVILNKYKSYSCSKIEMGVRRGVVGGLRHRAYAIPSRSVRSLVPTSRITRHSRKGGISSLNQDGRQLVVTGETPGWKRTVKRVVPVGSSVLLSLF